MSLMLSRRRFVIASAVTAGGVAALRLAPMATAAEEKAAAPLLAVDAWLELAPSGRARLLVNSSDIGQGAQTGLAQLVAEEMDFDPAQFDLEMAPVEPAFFVRDGSYYTGGSDSIVSSFEPFRRLGATARAMLLSAAAARWGVGIADCTTATGLVRNTKSGATLAYGALADTWLKQRVPAEPALKKREQWTQIGNSLPRFDTPAKTRGEARYGIDFTRPGLLNGALMAAPVFGARLESVDPAPALAVAGVTRVIRLENAVAVLAPKYWQARAGLAALKPRWSVVAGATDSAALSRALAAVQDAADAEVYVAEGSTREALQRDVDARFKRAARVIEAAYEVPFLAHCPLEPMNATAEFDANGHLTLWAPMQMQDPMRTNLMQKLGLRADQLTLHTLPAGGGFGRRLKTDYGEYAALVAREAKAPVKLIWSREEDMTHDHYRPATRTHLAAALGGDGRLLALRGSGGAINDTAVGGLARLAYPDVAIWCAQKNVKASVPVGAWRAVDATQNAFFVESLIDEIALALERDPLEYRRFLLAGSTRDLRLLDAAAERFGWGKPPAAGCAHGMAFFAGWGSRAVHMLEIGRDARGLPQLKRVVAAFDCGTAVNPDAVKAQVEGGVTMGLSAALGEAIHIRDGAVVERNFDAYTLLRNAQCPDIDVVLLDSPDVPVGGAGEPPLPAAAPALANAWAKLTGQRIRQLPLMDSVRAPA